MIGKAVASGAVTAGLAFAASSGIAACTQDPGPAPTEPTGSPSEVLATVIDCQTQDGTCVSGAKSLSDLTACNDALRACLTSLLPEAGPTPPRPPVLFFFDGGFPRIPVFDLFDGGFPTPPPLRFDGGFPPPPPLPQFDASLPTFPRFDGGPPPPPTLGDAGPSQVTCISDLQQCLASQTSATTCADQARTCLTAAQTAQCDDQEKQCVGAGLPQATCDAFRRLCGP